MCSVMNSLQRVWNFSNLSISTKVYLYQALIRSVLLYGTETYIDSLAQAVTNWRRFGRYGKWKYGAGRGRLESLCPAVCGSAKMSVSFDAHGPWCRFVEYRMSTVEYQTNFTHVLPTYHYACVAI